MMDVKVIVEQHSDGFVAYPVGFKGVVVAEGDSFEEALANVESAIQCHIETFGNEVLEVDDPVIQVFVADTRVAG